MTSKDKTENRAPREATLGPLRDRLKPSEAATVFRRLLKAHPDRRTGRVPRMADLHQVATINDGLNLP